MNEEELTNDTSDDILSRRERLDRREMWVALVVAILLPIPWLELIVIWRSVVVKRRTDDSTTLTLASIALGIAVCVVGIAIIMGVLQGLSAASFNSMNK